LMVLVPVVSATVASALSFETLKHGIADPGLRALIAPLVTFLPAGALTTGTLELASGEMVAGSSRLVFGSVQLRRAPRATPHWLVVVRCVVGLGLRRRSSRRAF
jgi:hypothetical protein